MTKHFVVQRTIRFGECDPGGIVYTPRITDFVVEAGMDFLDARLGEGAVRSLFAQGIAPPARAFSIEFLKPMTWDEELEIEVRLTEIRTHAFVLSFEGRVGEDKTFVAEFTQVCVATDSKQPTPIPEEIRRALSDQ